MQPLLRRSGSALLLLATLAAGVPAGAQQNSVVRENPPGAGSMAADLLVARPVGLATTVIGSAVFLVGLPFSLAGGNVGESGQALVVGPAKATFVRCLGCRNEGWRTDYGTSR